MYLLPPIPQSILGLAATTKRLPRARGRCILEHLCLLHTSPPQSELIREAILADRAQMSG